MKIIQIIIDRPQTTAGPGPTTVFGLGDNGTLYTKEKLGEERYWVENLESHSPLSLQEFKQKKADYEKNKGQPKK